MKQENRQNPNLLVPEFDPEPVLQSLTRQKVKLFAQVGLATLTMAIASELPKGTDSLYLQIAFGAATIFAAGAGVSFLKFMHLFDKANYFKMVQNIFEASQRPEHREERLARCEEMFPAQAANGDFKLSMMDRIQLASRYYPL